MVVSESPPGGEKVDTKQFSSLLEQGRLKEAKILLRKGVPDDIQGAWKSILSERMRDNPVDTSSVYWDTVDTCFGGRDIEDCVDRTPGCIDSTHTPSYQLDKESRAQVCRLVTCLAYTSPDVPYCPLLFPAAAVLRKHLGEEDCFGLLCMMVEPPKGTTYFTQSKRSWDISGKVLKPLAERFMKKHIAVLDRLCGRDQVEQALTSWVWWIFEDLPFPYLERIFTSFLMEGHKVLFRTGLAIIKIFSKQAAKPGSSLSSDLSSGGISKELPKFCRNLKIPVDELMEAAFKIQRFSKADILKFTLKIEMELKSRATIKEDGGRRRSNCELLSSDAVEEIIAVSDTLSYKQLLKLWSLIPERITMIMPKLVYSTNDHGTSIKTFYNRSEHYEPSILLIKTTVGDVFGAYCSTAWNVRNENDERGLRQRYFGTGETFLFKFNGENVEKFAWVGENQESGEKVDRATELFMSGDNSMLTIGGGDGTGLYLDENLEFGRTETCKTFNNPPLATESDFCVSVIEVFGFNNIEW